MSNNSKFSPGDMIGDYKLITFCGGGGFGEVWLAENNVVELKVALKIFHDAKKGKKECEAISKYQNCNHPNLIKIYHVGEHQGRSYYTMDRADNAGSSREYIADTLEYRIKRKKKLSPDEVYPIAEKIASALGCIHKAGLVHRDVKPGNIVFIGEEPVLADIGLVTDTAHDVSFAGTGGFIPGYVLNGEHDQCSASDFYALGVTLQRALGDIEDLTISGCGGNFHRLFNQLRESCNDFQKVSIYSAKDFLDCLNGSKCKAETSDSSKSSLSGKTSTKGSRKKDYQTLLEELYEQDIYTAPNIPEKKLKNALRSFAPGIKAEDVLLLADDTAFGSAKEGLILTKNALYGKEMWEKPKKISLFRNTTVSVKESKTLCINNYEFISLTQLKDKCPKLRTIIQAVCASHSDSYNGICKPEILPKQKSGCLKKIIIFVICWIVLGIIGTLMEEKEKKEAAASEEKAVNSETVQIEKKSATQPKTASVRQTSGQINDPRVQELLSYFPEHPQMSKVIHAAKNRPLNSKARTNKQKMAGLVWFYDEEKDELLKKIAAESPNKVSTEYLRKLSQHLWMRTKAMIHYLEYENKSFDQHMKFDDSGHMKVVDYIYTAALDDLKTPENESHPIFKTIFMLLGRFADTVPKETEKIINERIEKWKQNRNFAPKADLEFIAFQKAHAASLQKIRQFFLKYKNLSSFNASAQEDFYEIGIVLDQRNTALEKLQSRINKE